MGAYQGISGLSQAGFGLSALWVRACGETRLILRFSKLLRGHVQGNSATQSI